MLTGNNGRFKRVSLRSAFGLVCAPVLAGLSLTIAGCGGGDSNTNQSVIRSLNAYVPPTGTTSNGGIFIQTSSVLVTGASSLGFGQFANGGSYIGVNSGTFAPSVTGTGITTPFGFQSAPTLPGNNTAYTLVAAGQAGQTGTLTPQLVLIPNFTAGQIAIPSGDVAVRVVNFSLTPHPVGLYTSSNNVPTTAINTAFASVPYGYSSGTNTYVAIPTSQLVNLTVVDSTAQTVPLSLSSTSNLTTATFQSGTAYTLYVYGQAGNAEAPLGATWVVDYPM